VHDLLRDDPELLALARAITAKRQSRVRSRLRRWPAALLRLLVRGRRAP
jgi:hypothetical protein